VAAVSIAATAGLMFTMATAKPAWTTEATIEALPDLPDPVIVAPAPRSRILLPVPPAGDGSQATSTVEQALPQPVQLDPVVAPARVVTKTVVVKRGGGSTSAAASQVAPAAKAAPAATSGSTTVKSNGSK
jgi:hypothetical protein